jgi:pimeloyl-ACP methyl ester carboxylesterase
VNWRQYSLTHKELELAVIEHGPLGGQPLLALHGWRDNAASFERLAAELPEYRLIAPDFPGHGRSSRRHCQAAYYIWSYVEDVLALLDQLPLERCVLMGHSMGGAVAILVAALYPERVQSLVLLDAIGPLATTAEAAPLQMRESLDLLKTRKLAYRHHYPDFAAATAARASKGVSDAAALALAQRGVAQDEQGFYWQLDPRLNMKNLVSFTEEQSAAFMRKIACPVLQVAAKSFWLQREDWFWRRLGYLQNLETHVLDGNHHQHMEEQAVAVAGLIRSFVAGESGPRS